jgi:hypothetical protein
MKRIAAAMILVTMLTGCNPRHLDPCAPGSTFKIYCPERDGPKNPAP